MFGSTASKIFSPRTQFSPRPSPLLLRFFCNTNHAPETTINLSPKASPVDSRSVFVPLCPMISLYLNIYDAIESPYIWYADRNQNPVHYVGSLLDGTRFDSSFDREMPFKFKLGLGVKAMKKGEVAVLTIHPEYAFGLTEPTIIVRICFSIHRVDQGCEVGVQTIEGRGEGV